MQHKTCSYGLDYMRGMTRLSNIAHVSRVDLIGLLAQNVHLPCSTAISDLANQASAKISELTVSMSFHCCANCHYAWGRLTMIVDKNTSMPYYRHGFDFKSERSRERIHINLRQCSTCDTDEAEDSSDCDCDKCKPGAKRGRARQRGPFLLGQPRLAQQNIIQQNINLVPGVQGLRRRGSRPNFPILNVNHFDQWMGQSDSCIHGCETLDACPFCGPDQRGRSRPRHCNRDEDDLYNIDKAIRELRKAHEAQQKKQKKVQEAQDKKKAEMRKILCHNIEPDHTLPDLLFRQNDILEQRKNEIRREIEQCDADMKRLYEEAAWEAQFRGYQHRKTVMEQEQANRSDGLRYGCMVEEAADRTKKQPKSILVNKRVRFLDRMG